MNPKFAAVLCIGFLISFIFYERKKDYQYTNAIWLPIIWMFLSGSRYVSTWLKISPGRDESYTEGSPVDAAVFSIIITIGFFLLSKRKIILSSTIKKNKWLVVYLIYCALSLIWSEYPIVSVKRYIKEIGNFVIILIVLTDKNPKESIKIILRTLSIFWLSLSLLFVKYYPSLGRDYHWDGTQMFTGVGTQKNSLGKICLISGIYILWKILFEKRDREGSFKLERAIDIVIIFLTIWLLYLSKSATAFTCLAAVVCMFIIAKAKNISKNPDRLLYIGIVGFSLVILLEISIDLSAVLLSILNRDASLTTRVPIWEFLLEIEINKFIGTGYYSFWMGDRLQEIWEFTGKTINQAHNGYLEQYLNLGYIGLALTVIIIINGIITIRNELKIDYTLGILKLGFFFVAILYNFTEAAFYGLNNIWILFILSIIKINHENFKDQCKHQNLEAK